MCELALSFQGSLWFMECRAHQRIVRVKWNIMVETVYNNVDVKEFIIVQLEIELNGYIIPHEILALNMK